MEDDHTRAPGPYRGSMAVDPSLTDEAMQREIELVEALVLAASETDGPMTQESIDEALGVPAAAEPPADDTV